MSCNVGHNSLARLGYNALKVSKYQTRNLITNGFHQTNRLLNLDLFSFIRQQQCKGVHTTKDGEGDDSKSSGYHSSSKFHQQFHRRTYERKRSANDRDDKQQNQMGSIESETPVDHYQRLNVDHRADLNTIKSAYYSLSKLYHPDVVGSDDQKASENFRLITESYDTLSDPKSREKYDKQIDSVRDRQFNPDNPSWQPNGTGSSSKQQPAFHRVNSDLIFRIKNELAFEQEKRKNPRKFRAGSFRQEELESTEAESKIRLLDRQLSTLDLGINKDGDNFYRLHFRESIRRRREGLTFDSHKISKPKEANVELGTLVACFAIAIACLYSGINTMFDLDFASDLDDKLKRLQQGDMPPD